MASKTVGESMRACRESKGIRQTALADEAGIARTALSRYENDKQYPGALILITLADILDVTLDEYVGRDLGDTES